MPHRVRCFGRDGGFKWYDFKELGVLNGVLIKSIKMYDTITWGGVSTINFNKKSINLFSITESLFATLNVSDEKDNFLLQSFPVESLVGNNAVTETTNNYQFNFRANWNKSFIIFNRTFGGWNTNNGWLMQVYI